MSCSATPSHPLMTKSHPKTATKHPAPIHLLNMILLHFDSQDASMRQVYASFRHRILNLDYVKLLLISLWHKTNSYASFRHRFWILIVLSCCQLVHDIKQTLIPVCNIELWILTVFRCCHRIYVGHTKIIKYYQDMINASLIYVGHTKIIISYQDIPKYYQDMMYFCWSM